MSQLISIKTLFSRVPIHGILRVGHATSLRVAATGLTLVFGLVGARILGTATFGAYVSLVTIAGLLSVATSVGLPGLLQREVSSSRGSGDRSALKPLIQGVVLINGALVLALLAALALNATKVALILSFCLAGNAAGLLSSLFIAHERVLFDSWIGNVFRPVVALVALVVLASLTTPTELLPLYAQIMGAAAAFVLLLVMWRGEPISHARRALATSWWSDRHAPIVRAGLIFGGTQVLINLTTQIDILILTAMASPTEVAHYYAAVRAAMVINFFFGASGLLAEPALTRLFASGNIQGVQKLATSTALTGAIVTTFATLAAIVIAPYYLRLYGPDFIVALPSFVVFAAGLAARSLFGPAAPMLRATRSEMGLLIVTAVVLALNVVISACLIPFLGILGAAIGSGIQFAIYGWLLSRMLSRRQTLRSDVFSVFRRRDET